MPKKQTRALGENAKILNDAHQRATKARDMQEHAKAGDQFSMMGNLSRAEGHGSYHEGYYHLATNAYLYALQEALESEKQPAIRQLLHKARDASRNAGLLRTSETLGNLITQFEQTGNSVTLKSLVQHLMTEDRLS